MNPYLQKKKSKLSFKEKIRIVKSNKNFVSDHEKWNKFSTILFHKSIDLLKRMNLLNMY